MISKLSDISVITGKSAYSLVPFLVSQHQLFGTQIAIEIMTMLMGNVILEQEITKLGFNY